MLAETTPKILVVGPAWVGDMVMAHTLFQCLKQKNPNAIIDVIAPAWTHTLLSQMPEIRRAIELPLQHGEFQFSHRYRLAKKLREENYTQAIVLPNSWKSALIPFLARIPQRTGWLGEMRFGLLNDFRFLNKKKYPLMIERFAALAFEKGKKLSASLPTPFFHIHPNLQENIQQKFSLSITKKILILCPGAEYGPAKRWPARYFATIAEKKKAEGWDVWLLGSAKDKAITQHIQSLTQDQCVDFAGKTTLHEAIVLMHFADAVVTNDSGLMHIASALNKKIIALFGSSSPTFTPPLGQHVSILSQELACSPCFKRECPYQHMKCLLQLKPEFVLTQLEKLS